MSRTTSIVEYFNELPEVKRIHELESYIDSNETIKNEFEELKKIQRLMVSSKEFHQVNQYKEYKESYLACKERLLDLPFVEEYLELLEIVDSMLKEFTNSIEYYMNKKING